MKKRRACLESATCTAFCFFVNAKRNPGLAVKCAGARVSFFVVNSILFFMVQKLKTFFFHKVEAFVFHVLETAEVERIVLWGKFNACPAGRTQLARYRPHLCDAERLCLFNKDVCVKVCMKCN